MNPFFSQNWLSSSDLSKAFEEGYDEFSDMLTNNHPFYYALYKKYDSNLDAESSVNCPLFKEDAKDFPSLPRHIKPELLYPLGVHFNKEPISLQRNFWIYLMLKCDQETYNKFTLLHSEEIREMVSPTC